MIFYAAPLEGITGYVYRRAHNEFFPGAAKYFTPFIFPNKKTLLRSREMRDVLPENNQGVSTAPQILTNSAEDFLDISRRLEELGYSEINLNLGCPSGTVVSKKRGAGFLSLPEELEHFFDAIFSECDVSVSVKTRIGFASAEELPRLMDIFEKYPISELIVHPRTGVQKYGGAPDMEAFRYVLARAKCPVCYNGDLLRVSDVSDFSGRFKSAGTVMIGRGLIADPFLITRCVSGARADKTRLRQFHDRLLADYCAFGLGDKNVLFKMKELWSYMIRLFSDSARHLKAIDKSQRICDYCANVDRLFDEREMTDGLPKQALVQAFSKR